MYRFRATHRNSGLVVHVRRGPKAENGTVDTVGFGKYNIDDMLRVPEAEAGEVGEFLMLQHGNKWNIDAVNDETGKSMVEELLEAEQASLDAEDAA